MMIITEDCMDAPMISAQNIIETETPKKPSIIYRERIDPFVKLPVTHK